MTRASVLAPSQQAQVVLLAGHLVAASAILTDLWESLSEANTITAQREIAGTIKRRLKKAGRLVDVIPDLRSTLVDFKLPKVERPAFGLPVRPKVVVEAMPNMVHRCIPCGGEMGRTWCTWCRGGGFVTRATRNRMSKVSEDPHERDDHDG